MASRPAVAYRMLEEKFRSHPLVQRCLRLMERCGAEPVAFKVRTYLNRLFLAAAAQGDIAHSVFTRQLCDLAIVLAEPRFAGELPNVFDGITGNHPIRLQITSGLPKGNYGGIAMAVVDLCNNQRQHDPYTPIATMVNTILADADALCAARISATERDALLQDLIRRRITTIVRCSR